MDYHILACALQVLLDGYLGCQNLNFVKEDHRHMITLLRKAFVGAGKNVFVGAGRKFVAKKNLF